MVFGVGMSGVLVVAFLGVMLVGTLVQVLTSTRDDADEVALSRYRKHALFWVGFSIVLLWTLPIPVVGELGDPTYVYKVDENSVRYASLEGITFLRQVATVGAWAGLTSYVLMPLLMRMKKK